MGKFKDNNFYTIFGWMKNSLGLSGNEREAYAMIYCFTLNCEEEQKITLSYIMDALGIQKPTAIKVLSRLTEKGYIIRVDDGYNKPRYRYNPNSVWFLDEDNEIKMVKKFNHQEEPDVTQMVKKINHDGKEILPQMVNEFDHNGKEILPHINNINIKEKNINNTKETINKMKGRKSRKVSDNPPTFDEFKAYIDDNNLNVDAEYQYKYWSEGGWLDYFGNDMYNWKGQLLTKSRNNDKYKPRLEGMKTETDDRQLRDIKEWQKANEEKDDLPF